MCDVGGKMNLTFRGGPYDGKQFETTEGYVYFPHCVYARNGEFLDIVKERKPDPSPVF